MKIGRNDPCPCGSGKKYKKCCLLKDETEEKASPFSDASDEEDGDFLNLEAIVNMYTGLRNLTLKGKPHIIEYKKIRKMHGEIVDSMIDYYQEDKFEQKIDHAYKPDFPHTRKSRKEAKTVYLYELDFDMESERSMHAFYDMLIYKSTPNVSCITEDFIDKRRYRKPEKIEFLQSMLDSRLGLFELTGAEPEDGYAYIRDVLNASEYKMTDVGLSGGMKNAKDMLIYTRIITYRGVSFGTGLSLTFNKNDSFIKSFIKRHSADYHSFGEYGRFVELYRYHCKSPSKATIVANRL